MKLSMWIIANLLESFEPEVHIRRESPRVLRSARLAYATDCVLVQQDGPDCLYLWNEDSIRLPDLSAGRASSCCKACSTPCLTGRAAFPRP